MIWSIEERDNKGLLWKVYMCQSEDEIKQIQKEHGFVDSDSISKFRFEDKKEYKVIIAKVKTICSNVFEQVYVMAQMVGFTLPFDALLRIIKTFER